MESNYWLGRWQRGETGWHQSEVEPVLVQHFSDLKPTRVLVPLCGKSLDMVWLASKGHEVIGVELSEQASRAFFVENKIPHQESVQGEFKVFEGGGVTIFCGNFFATTSQLIGEVGAVYDRAALIALPASLRPQYARHIQALVEKGAQDKGFRFLQVVLERTPHDNEGPPHSVPVKEVERLYSDRFKVQLLSREPIEGTKAPMGSRVEECVLMLTVHN